MAALRHLTVILLIVCGWLPTAARAATLQISPVSVEFQPGENASGITLHNPGDRPIYGQVRVFRWDEASGHETLTSSRDLIASPPIIEIPPHRDQLVRLVRFNSAQVAAEQSFRVLVDELPEPGEVANNGVMIRLRYSVPVFVEPTDKGQPELTWRITKDTSGWVIHVENGGTRRAQIAAVTLITSTGQAYTINKGLLGYALVGQAGQWVLPLPADVELKGKATIRATVNAIPLEATVLITRSGG